MTQGRTAGDVPGETLAYLWGYLQEAGRTIPALTELLGEAVLQAEAVGLPVPIGLYPLPSRTRRPSPDGWPDPPASPAWRTGSSSNRATEGASGPGV